VRRRPVHKTILLHGENKAVMKKGVTSLSKIVAVVATGGII